MLAWVRSSQDRNDLKGLHPGRSHCPAWWPIRTISLPPCRRSAPCYAVQLQLDSAPDLTLSLSLEAMQVRVRVRVTVLGCLEYWVQNGPRFGNRMAIATTKMPGQVGEGKGKPKRRRTERNAVCTCIPSKGTRAKAKGTPNAPLGTQRTALATQGCPFWAVSGPSRGQPQGCPLAPQRSQTVERPYLGLDGPNRDSACTATPSLGTAKTRA